MGPREIHLDRVSLDDVVMRRLSATLHFDDSRSAAEGSPWFVYLACEPAPGRFRVGANRVRLNATLVSGRRIDGEVRITERRDDVYGTTLILAGIKPRRFP